MGFSFDATEFLVRLAKYAIEGLCVGLAAYFFTKNPLQWDEIFLVALTSACTFSLLDFFAPSIGSSARMGAGFGLGSKLVGFPR